ncbi:hypothetical protein M758_1G214100 [Ceratodon purpureus]|nr:hypothetical protein M758_1G214100 [Ceratodon purpureus]
MAQRPLKSLNKGPGAKRFVFKNFATRVEEVDVDVFRSLAPVKFQPTAGSSFFHENLVQWRELNSAADFNDVYQQLLPVVQTLPQLLFHKETVMECLLSRVHMTSALSLEPIMSLIALLSRDLREDFLPFIPRFLDSCVGVLKEGADRDPDLIEQVFTSISYVIKYLSKLLTNDIPFCLKVTRGLRYYSKSYVQEFAAEAISFLLRNASMKQLIKGVRKIVAEAEADPRDEKISGSAALFCYTLRGPSFGLHSRAEPLLRLLLDRSVLCGVTKRTSEGRSVALKVVTETLSRIIEDVHREKLELLWTCLREEIVQDLEKISLLNQATQNAPLISSPNLMNGDAGHTDKASFKGGKSSANGALETSHEPSDKRIYSKEDVQFHLTACLSLLNGVLEYRKGTRVNDYKPLFGIATSFLQPQFLLVNKGSILESANSVEDSDGAFCSEILRLLLALVKSHGRQAGASFGPATIAKTAPTWALAFTCQKSSCLLPFIRGIIEQDFDLVRPFVPYLLSALSGLIEDYASEVLPLVLDLCLKMEPSGNHAFLLKHVPKSTEIITFIIKLVDDSTTLLRECLSKDKTAKSQSFLNHETALVWMAMQCFPHVVAPGADHSQRAWEFAVALEDYIAAFNKGEIEDSLRSSGNMKKMLETLLGAALSAHTKVLQKTPTLTSIKECASTFLGFANRHIQSGPVLKAVADYLEASFGPLQVEGQPREYPEELSAAAALKILAIASANLGSADKMLRLATLRVLSYFEPLSGLHEDGTQNDPKRQKRSNDLSKGREMNQASKLIQQLLSIEAAPLVLENCRQSNLVVTHIKVDVSAGRIPEAYVVPLVHAMIGVLRNRFSVLWDPAMDCLAALVDTVGATSWDVVIAYLHSFQEDYLSQPVLISRKREDAADDSLTISQDAEGRLVSQLLEETESTDTATLLTLVLRTIQKLPKFAEAKSRQLLPLFLAFVGQPDEDSDSSEVVKGGSGKDWKKALKEWLTLLKDMKNARAFYKGALVKDILLNRILMDNDPSIQALSLECLLNWKDGYLTSHVVHLQNLISYSTLREELVTWTIGRETHQVQEEHRPGLIAVILRILYPKIMKRSGKFAGKVGAGVQRNSVLQFLAQLETAELAPLFSLLLKPLQTSFSEAALEVCEGSTPKWEAAILKGEVTSKFIDWVDVGALAALQYKRKMGFLHMVKDSLDIFDRERIGPYLHALLGLVFKCLESTAGICEESLAGNEGSEPTDVIANDALEFESLEKTKIQDQDPAINTPMEVDDGTDGSDGKSVSTVVEIADKDVEDIDGDDLNEDEESEKPKTSPAGSHDLRTLCLKIIATVLAKFDDFDYNPVYWDIFFQSISPSIQKFAAENHSSIVPGAVFSCLLSMGKSVLLAPLISRDPTLVPNVVAVFSYRTATPAVIVAVVSFIEGLLNLEEEGGEDGKDVVKKVLLPHLQVLLARVHDLLTIRREKVKGKKSAFSVKRELRILSRLSHYVKDDQEAAKLVDVLLPFLKAKKRMDQDVVMEVLRILRGLAPALDAQSVHKCLPALAPLLASVSMQGNRIALCEALEEFARVDSSVSSVAKLLGDLNAMSTTTMEEFDYDRRLQAYERMDASLFAQLNRSTGLLVLSQAVFDMGSEDISLRHSSSSCLQSFVKFASSLPEEESSGDLEGGKADEMHEDVELALDAADGEVVGDALEVGFDVPDLHIKAESGSVKSLVQRFLLPHVRNAMGSELLVVRREWVALLREMALSFSTIPALKEYQALVNTDPEVDFFYNIVHLQVHRRSKAMAKFRTLCAAGHFSQGALLRIFVPLFMNSIFEAKGDKEGNLVGAAIETVACIASQLQWEPYFGLLMRSFRFLSSKLEHQKVLIRLVCATLDAFHFFESTSEESFSEDAEIETNNALTRKLPAGIEGLLRKRVLPEFTKVMVSNMDIVNASVALALVKILKLMPEEVVEVELPRIVQSITNLLKNRNSQAVRDEARSALVSVTATLGPRYLHFIAGVLKGSLTKGFEVHVLGYTLYSVLVKLLETVKVGEIDYCLPLLLEMLENDIMGEVAEEKNVEAIAIKMKETKHMRSFESMRLVAQVITFPTQVPTMLGPVRRNLPKTFSPKNRVKVETMLKQIALGLQSNSSVSQETLFVLVHGLLEDGLKEENAVALALAAKNQAKLEGKGSGRLSKTITGKSAELNYTKDKNRDNKEPMPTGAGIPNAHLLTEFALQLFFSHLKKVKISFQDQLALSMLDPLVDLFFRFLSSKYDGVLSGVMRCLSILVKLPLPSVDKVGAKMSKLVFNMAQRSGKTDTPVMQACFQLLITLIRHCKTAKITDEQLRLLLRFPVFSDLESTTGSTALSLLKAVVSRKLLVPELYDMMTRVSEVMVQSQLAPVRQVCSRIFLQFLLDYPLGAKRLQQHLDFLLTNLGYEHASGREAALEMLHTVITKFPETVIEEHAESIFLPLVARLVNDNDNHVRAMVGTVLKVLMSRVGPRALQRMVEFSLTWYKGDNSRLWRPAAQVLGFLIEVMKGKFEKHTEEVIEATTKILRTAASESEEEGDDILDWQETYASLIMSQKLLQQFPQFCLQAKLQEFWELVCSLLLHKHSWIRLASGRLLGMYYDACGENNRGSSKAKVLLHPSWLLLVAGFLCEQLDAEVMDSALADQIVKNLLYISSALPASESAFQNSEPQSRLRIEQAKEILGANKKGLKMDAQNLDTEDGVLEEDEDLPTESGNVDNHSNGNSHSWALRLVFRRLEKVALRVQPIQGKAVLQWFAAMATRLGAGGVQPYLRPILTPLYKITEGSAAKQVQEELKAYGDEVLNELRGLLGVNEFVQVYNNVRQGVKDLREKRKRAQKLNVLVDPERNAKRKIRLNHKRQAQKKRKIIDSKRKRGL